MINVEPPIFKDKGGYELFVRPMPTFFETFPKNLARISVRLILELFTNMG